MKLFFPVFLIFFSISVFSQEKITLSYRFQNNDTYSVKMKIFSKSIQEVAGSPQEVSTDQKIFYKLSFLKKDSTPNYDISVKFNNIASTVNQSGYKQVFNSDSLNNEVSKIFNNFLHKKLTYRLTEKGNLSPLYSLNELFPDSAEKNQISVFSQTVEQKVSTDLPVSIIFPPYPIQKGDTWKVPDTVSSGIFNYYNKAYSLDSVSDTEYFITEHSDFSSNPQKAFLMNKVFISYDIKGKSTNNYISDKHSCIIKTGKIQQSGNGTVYMKYTKDSDPAYTWKMQISNEISLTSEKQTND